MVYMEPLYPSATDVAAAICRVMDASGTSVDDLSETSGVPAVALAACLAGGSFGWEELVAVARALGRSASSLITEAEGHGDTA